MARGIIADDDCIFFAESALGITDETGIARLLNDTACYGEGLCDIVFTPPESLRRLLEIMVPPEGLPDKACEYIAELIMGSLKHTLVSFGTSGNSAAVSISKPIVSKFLTRLNLNRRVTCIPEAEAAGDARRELLTRMRVIVRNARCDISPAREKFISEMIRRMTSDSRIPEKTVVDCLEFMLELFDEFAGDDGVSYIISEKKRHLESQLSDMARCRDFTEKYSMDYLMSRKILMPAVDHEETMNRIFLTDLIGMTMHGEPDDAEMRR